MVSWPTDKRDVCVGLERLEGDGSCEMVQMMSSLVVAKEAGQELCSPSVDWVEKEKEKDGA